MNNSIMAYFNAENQKKFKSRKAKIVRDLNIKRSQSRFSLGRRLCIDDIEIQRRLSDLINEGTIKVTGERKHGENTISLYSLVEQLQLFDIPKKANINVFLKEYYPHILIEFNGRNNYKL